MKNQVEFNRIVQTLTQKVKPGDEWKINLSQELKRYQEYTQYTRFGGEGHSNDHLLIGSFVEAGLVVENASSIYSLRVDSAFTEVFKCAESIRKSILQLEKSTAKETRPEKTPKVKQKMKIKQDVSTSNFNLLHHIKHINIKQDSSRREILEDELISGFKFIPPYLNKKILEKKSSADPANTEYFNTFNEVTSHKFDYLINGNLLDDYEDMSEDEGEEEEAQHEPGRRQSCSEDSIAPSLVDSGIGSSCSASTILSESEKQESIKEMFTEFLTYLDDTINNFLTSDVACQFDVDHLIESVNPIRKNLEILIENSKDLTSHSNISPFKNMHKENFFEKNMAVTNKTLFSGNEVQTPAWAKEGTISANVKEVTKENTAMNLNTNVTNQSANIIEENSKEKMNVAPKVSKENSAGTVGDQQFLHAIDAASQRNEKNALAANKIICVQTTSVIKHPADQANNISSDKSKLINKIEAKKSAEINTEKSVNNINEAKKKNKLSNNVSANNLFNIPSSVLIAQNDFDYSQDLFEDSTVGILKLPMHHLHKIEIFNIPSSLKLKRNHESIEKNDVPQKVAKIKASRAIIDTESDTTEIIINNVTVKEKNLHKTTDSTIKKKIPNNKEGDNNNGDVNMDASSTSNAELLNSIENTASTSRTFPKHLFDDFEDLGVLSPGSNFYPDVDSQPSETLNDANKPVEKTLKELLPQLEKVSMLTRLDKDLDEMLLTRHASFDQGYASVPDSPCYTMCDEDYAETEINNSVELLLNKLPNRLSVESGDEGFSDMVSQHSSGIEKSSLSDKTLISSTPLKASFLKKTKEAQCPLSPIIKKISSKNSTFFERPKSLKEKYCRPDSATDNRIQQWRDRITSKLEFEQSNIYELKEYKKFILHWLTKMNGKECSLGDIIAFNPDVGNGRFLLATLQLINEKKILLNKLNLFEFDDPRNISLRLNKSGSNKPADSSGIFRISTK